MTRNKKIIIVSILSLFILSLFAFVFVGINLFEKEETKAAETFSVYNYNDLVRLRERVHSVDDVVNVEIKNDINCGGGNLEPIGWGETSYYSGTFNGNGYTISNFKVTSVNATRYNGVYAAGILGYVQDATIKNLRINNAQYNFNAQGQLYVGGIVGYCENTVITNCEVSNIKVGDSSSVGITYAGFCNIGGISGYGGNISHCYVEALNFNGYLNLRDNSTNKIVLSGICNDASSINHCVYNPRNSNWYIRYINIALNEWGTLHVYQNGLNKFSPDGYNNECIYIRPIGYEYGNCLSGTSISPEAYRPFSNVMSNKGGKYVEDSYGKFMPWYQNSSYSSYPRLRMFMSWKQWTIVNGNPSVATLSGTSPIELPSDYSPNITDLSSREIVVGGNRFSISVNNEDYQFTGWTISGQTIRANIEALYGTIVFTSVSNANINTATLTYKVAKNTTITKSETKSSVSFSFAYNGGTQTVTYTAVNNKYFRSASNLPTTKVEGAQTVTISPTFILKEYSVTLG